jgi:hypothetical protein
MDVMPRGLDELVWDLVSGRRGILDLDGDEAEAIDSAVPELVSCLSRSRETAPQVQAVTKIAVRRTPPPKPEATSSATVDFSKAYDWLK